MGKIITYGVIYAIWRLSIGCTQQRGGAGGRENRCSSVLHLITSDDVSRSICIFSKPAV